MQRVHSWLLLLFCMSLVCLGGEEKPLAPFTVEMKVQAAKDRRVPWPRPIVSAICSAIMVAHALRKRRN
jgi:hypothetical protein